MKHAACLLALVIVVHFCTGCATVVTGGGEDQAVRFASTPRGATVYVDDNPVGQTPISVRLTRKDEHRVRIEHAGYKTYERTIGSGFNEWMLGNVIIGGLIGLSVDLLSGANPALDTNNVSVKMVHDNTAVVATPPSGYTTTSPPGAARPAAYMNSAPAPAAAPPKTYTAPPAYQPPPAYQQQPAPAPQARPVPAPAPQARPAPAPAPAPARQQPQPAANAGTYRGW